MNYLNDIFNQLTDQQINKIFENNKSIFEKNKEMLLNYVK